MIDFSYLPPELIFEIVKKMDEMDRLMFGITTRHHQEVCNLIKEEFDKEVIEACFNEICESGSVVDFSRFVKKYPISENFIGKVYRGGVISLRSACSNGRIGIAKWIIQRLHLDEDYLLKRDNRILKMIASGGHVGMIKWLTDYFNLLEQQLNPYLDDMVESASGNGSLEMIKYLLGKYPDHYNKCKENEEDPEWVMLSFNVACENNHTETIKWLSVEWVDSWTEHSFYHACANGNLELAKWFLATYEIEKEDLVESSWNYWKTFEKVCQKGELEVLRWMTDALEITHDDIFRYEFAHFLVNNIFKCDLEVVKFFMIHFNVKKDDIMDLFYEIKQNIIKQVCKKPWEQGSNNKNYQWICKHLKL